MLIPGNNGICTQVPVDDAGDDPDGILITEAPDFITVSTEDELNADHVIYDLAGTL